MVFKLLSELAKVEGWQYLTSIKLNDKAIEKMTADVAKEMPDSGKLEVCYSCPADSVREEWRVKLGQKYFDWLV